MSLTLEQLKQEAGSIHDWMIDIRRHLHRNPEVSYHEHETTRYILGKLEELGIETERPLETGCLGIVKGNHPDSRVIALRADIDALAMEEEGEHKQEFLSRRPGTAHCCGHDAHTANMLGAARLLADHREDLEGTVILIFQPAEEKLPGGGRLLCETGFLDRWKVERVVGLHSSPAYPPGTIATRPGPMMARPDEFEIELIGKGGHAASPHQTIDPIVMAAETILKLQTVVSRNMDPTEPTVLTVGKMEGGTTYNVIPGKARLEGTVRTFDGETARTIRDRMQAIVDGVAHGSGGEAKFLFKEGYPAVVNDEEVTAKVTDTARRLLGEEAVIEMERPIMAGEDFSFYQQHIPGTFYLLGSGSEEAESTWSWHHPRYNVDEQCFLTGAPLMAALALDL